MGASEGEQVRLPGLPQQRHRKPRLLVWGGISTTTRSAGASLAK
jgi:hypothetical protein